MIAYFLLYYQCIHLDGRVRIIQLGRFFIPLYFKNNGKCHLVVDENFAEEILHVPEESPEGDKVVSIYVKSRVKKIFLSATIESVTEHDESGAEIIFWDWLKSVSEGAFLDVYDVTFPASLIYIDDNAFEFD
ncbi:MAG: hypothetical protein IJK81_11380 [Selenomonadaceae bacterium]|nr:hypothetical protein [Selenomonadaceae bacterium]